MASADGMRFVVPVRTVHAGPNPKYFGFGRGVTWYNLLSDQCSGLNAITVPGTLRDSLVLLAVVLEQQTELQPTKIMTDTGAYSDVVFGLFRLLGYRFSPRLADIGGTRFWRIDANADYGELNIIARQRVSLVRIEAHWDDFLRLAGSLKLGLVPATGIMRTLQVGERPTKLALALAEFGRIEKTLHTLKYIDDENLRRSTLLQLNRGEGRHGFICSASAIALLVVCSLVALPLITSTSFITGTGLKKCMPMTRPAASPTLAAMSEMEIDDVFVANTTSSRNVFCICRKMFFLRPISSTTASMAQSASPASAISV